MRGPCIAPVGRESGRESGQAAVESALVMPLAVFLILGTLQLFMLLQGRIMAEYAAWRAVRAGSVNYGACDRMVDAAVASLLPTFSSFLGQGTPGSTPAEKLGRAFGARRNNRFDPALDDGHSEHIVWIFRESPPRTWALQAGGQDVFFDYPREVGQGVVRLEIRMVYWMPLRIPFADWVMTRMFLAQYGFEAYTNANPLIGTQTANWQQEVTAPFDGAIRDEWMRRYNLRQYVFPIHATATMRMMTPVKAVHFRNQHCPPLCTPGFPC